MSLDHFTKEEFDKLDKLRAKEEELKGNRHRKSTSNLMAFACGICAAGGASLAYTTLDLETVHGVMTGLYAIFAATSGYGVYSSIKRANEFSEVIDKNRADITEIKSHMAFYNKT